MVSLQPGRGFGAQLRALLYKGLQQHTKAGHLAARAVRMLVPLIIVCLVHLFQKYGGSYRKTVATKLLSMGLLPDKRTAAKFVGGFFRATVDFSLCLSAITIALLYFPTITSDRVADRLSGLRFLLRSNGLSSAAYWLSSSIESFAVVAVDILLLLAGGHLLGVRFVLKSSPILIIAAIIALSSALVATSFAFCQMISSQRIARMLPLILFIATVWASPISCFYDEASYFSAASAKMNGEATGSQTLDAPSGGGGYHLGWRSKYTTYLLAFPPHAAYCVFHNLAMSCAADKCLSLNDLFAPLVGESKLLRAYGKDTFSLLCLVAFEVTACWILVALLDYSSRSHNVADRAEPPKTKSGHSLLAKIDDLEKSYGNFKALDGVSFTVEQGACVGLLGPNGAGKSTLCKILTRQLPSSGGELRTYSRKATFHKGGTASENDFMGVCPQDTVLFEHLTVLDHLHFFAKLRGMKGGPHEDALCEEFLELVRLKDKAHCFPNMLSGGTQRKLSVCLSLIASPGCIVLDEPTTGIDAKSRKQIWAFVQKSLMGGCGALVTTHMLDEAENLCSKLVILREGKIAETGTTQELKEKYGEGYELHVDYNPVDEKRVLKFMRNILPAKHGEPSSINLTGQMIFQVGKVGKVVGKLFCVMDEQASAHGVKYWGIQQQTLADAYNRIVDDEEAE